MNIKSFIPLIGDLKNYNRTHLKGDFLAGITIGVMLIPQAMAYSMLAGLPPIYGLYASTISILLYAVFGTSRQLSVGPVAMVALLIATGVGNLAEPGSSDYISLAIVLAFMVGIIQAIMGVFRLGFLVNFLSNPVISGFTSAAALIIGFSQLKHLLGIDLPRSNYIHVILLNSYNNINQIHFYTFLLGIGGIATILLVKRYTKRIPGSLVALILSILVVYFFDLHENGIKILKDVPDGFPSPKMPVFLWNQLIELLPIALTISFVGFIQSVAIAKAIQRKHKNYKIVPNSELIALGIANIGGSLFQAFPITGGFSRTAVNDQTGAKTGLASIISALLIILTLLFFTPLFYYLPQAILASIILVAVFSLIDINEVKHLWKTDKADFFMLIVAFLGTLFIGIEEGIILGVGLSIGMILYRTMKPHIAVVGQIKGTNIYRNLERFEDAIDRNDVLIVRFDARIYFANVSFFKEKIERLIEKKTETLKIFILEAQSINAIDSSGVNMLFDILEECKEEGIQMIIIGLNGPIRDTLYKAGFVDALGIEHFFNRTHEAMECYDSKKSFSINLEADKYPFQTNIN